MNGQSRRLLDARRLGLVRAKERKLGRAYCSNCICASTSPAPLLPSPFYRASDHTHALSLEPQLRAWLCPSLGDHLAGRPDPPSDDWA
jgi:hypothetical protein